MLNKRNIHMNRVKCRNSMQFMLDSDCNVPDMKPDAGRMVQARGDIRLNEKRVANEKLYLNGVLSYQLLYIPEGEKKPMQGIKGELPFDEIMNMEGATGGEEALVSYELEDLSMTLINSRKLSIKAVIRINAAVEEMYDEEAGVSFTGVPCVEQLPKSLRLTNLGVDTRDTFRLKEEIVLPSGKGEISELLYNEVLFREPDIRLMDGRFTARGELGVFFFYQGNTEGAATEYYETELPFTATVDCSGCEEDMIPDITFTPVFNNLTVKADEDGEDRVVELEMSFDIRIKLYREEELEILEDVYSTCKGLMPVFHEAEYESLIGRNVSKLRINERVELGKEEERLLQVCHTGGNVKLDEVRAVEGGLEAEGIVELTIFYITADEEQPIRSMRTMLPFRQLVEIKEMAKIEENTGRYEVHASLEQASVMIADAHELEVRASVQLSTLVFNGRKQAFIVDVEEADRTGEMMRGMTGYRVRPGDSLWNIAKKYQTTRASLIQINELGDEGAKPGDSLLIVNEMAGVV